MKPKREASPLKGEGGSSRESRDAVSSLPKTQPKRPKRRKPLWKLAIAPGELHRAQARTLTETLETLRQTGETHAKNTEFRNSNLDLLNWMKNLPKPCALTAQEKSLPSSREAILNAAKVVDQKNKEVEAQQKINGLAKQANKQITICRKNRCIARQCRPQQSANAAHNGREEFARAGPTGGGLRCRL
ncbi:hypothetical protein ACVXG7_09305 [Enterobacter hormaechei]